MEGSRAQAQGPLLLQPPRPAPSLTARLLSCNRPRQPTARTSPLRPGSLGALRGRGRADWPRNTMVASAERRGLGLALAAASVVADVMKGEAVLLVQGERGSRRGGLSVRLRELRL